MLAAGVLLWACGAHAQTLPLPPGAGFEWEIVGDYNGYPKDLHFDAGGTLWLADNDPPLWLDLRTGWPGVWQRPNPPNPQPSGDAMLTLGGHPAGGPPRADTVLVALSGGVNRSTNGGATWEGWRTEDGGISVYEIPAGLPHGGRLLTGNLIELSDDRGATWRGDLYDIDVLPFEGYGFLALPGPAGLPGAASGRDVAAPAGWPTGRVVAVGYGAVAALSDTGGETWRAPANGIEAGRRSPAVVLVRRPDSHPLGPGPRLLRVGSGEATATSVWASDDAGETWTQTGWLSEPSDGPGWPSPTTVLALPEPGEADPGAGGRALAVLRRGHLFETTDGGETWTVVGRMPGIRPTGDPDGPSIAMDAELGPDGRLYVITSRDGVWRTAAPFVVAADDAPSSASGLSLSVSPNPSTGAVTFTLSSREAAAVHVVVTDATGRRVTTVEAWATPEGTSVAVDASGWASGVYVARAGAGSASARFTVVR